MSAAAVMQEQACPRCGWPASDGECRRAADSGDACDLYAFADVVVTIECDGWSPPRAADLVSVRAPIALRPVPPTVYAKRPRKSPLGGPPVAKIALYRPAVAPTFPRPWSVEELAAMGTVEHSEEWKRWYAAMPAKMTRQQERDYFMKGPVA